MTVDLAARPHPSDKIKLKEVIKGCEEPRVYTKPLRNLTPRTSHGFACIAFAEQVLGLKLMPWQKWILIHALELRRDGSYRFRRVVCLVARQNGKTLVMQILALWHIFAKGSRWVMSTAQDLSNSEKAWNEARQMAHGVSELSDMIGDEKFQRGQKLMALRSEFGECTWFVKSANRRSGRGFSCELVLLDEIREHTNFECWAAVTKTTRARADAQIWAFSNAGEFNSVVLRHLRALGHRDLGWPDGELDTESLELPDMSEFEQEFDDDDIDVEFEDDDEDNALGFFEYSADPRLHRKDPRGWAQANPSLNHTEVTRDCVTTRVMRDDLHGDPPGVFDTECLCRWVATLDHGPFEIGSWDDTFDDDARFAPETERVICVEVNLKRSLTYVARCGPAAGQEGYLVLDIAAARPGTNWVVDWLKRNRARYTAIVVRGSGAPAASLVDSMQAVDLDKVPDAPTEPDAHDAALKLAADMDDVARQIPFMDDLLEADLPIVLLKGDDLGKASGIMYDRLSTRTLKHLSHPALDAAAKTAKIRMLRDAWVIDMKNSPTDAAPLVAGIGAVWGMSRYYTTPSQVVPQVHQFSPEQLAEWEKQAREQQSMVGVGSAPAPGDYEGF